MVLRIAKLCRARNTPPGFDDEMLTRKKTLRQKSPNCEFDSILQREKKHTLPIAFLDNLSELNVILENCLSGCMRQDNWSPSG
jgi:hypothetical protein